MQTLLQVRKILVLATNPKDTSGLQLDEELRNIQLARNHDQCQSVSEWAIRTDDLIQSLMSHPLHVIHFAAPVTGMTDLSCYSFEYNPP